MLFDSVAVPRTLARWWPMLTFPLAYCTGTSTCFCEFTLKHNKRTKRSYSVIACNDQLCINSWYVVCINVVNGHQLMSLRAGKPPQGLHLDVMKGDKLMEVTGNWAIFTLYIISTLLCTSVKACIDNCGNSLSWMHQIRAWQSTLSQLWCTLGLSMAARLQTVREQQQPWDLSFSVGSNTVKLWLRGTET